ncbi:MAG: hypothetical protein UV67_C0014G0001 [Parcubacteria group bacterium GW2011_GWC1_43_12]|nr:MAG: hypothetical protein UV34_C0014G0001 [Parcubacteria group bacterium GW2011_GWB1_42_6]KKS91940.1 MAG: hypothetical protein UV67_C0014G0001 [Parcubacteria group bacterium GW2011_GWC1_43_12]
MNSPEDIKAAVGGLLRQIRIEKGLTQASIARKIDCARPNISQMEVRVGMLDSIVSFYNAMDFSIADFFHLLSLKLKGKSDSNSKNNSEFLVRVFGGTAMIFLGGEKTPLITTVLAVKENSITVVEGNSRNGLATIEYRRFSRFNFWYKYNDAEFLVRNLEINGKEVKAPFIE